MKTVYVKLIKEPLISQEDSLKKNVIQKILKDLLCGQVVLHLKSVNTKLF